MNKRTYSKPQRLYMIAEANLKVAEDKHNAAETLYIKKRGITNPDGSTPKLIYMIEDETIFETANAEFSEIPEHKEIWAEILEAREMLKAAETNLLDYAFNVVPIPKKEKDTLTESAKTNYTTRKKLIDLVMNLDVTTLPKNLVLR